MKKVNMTRLFSTTAAAAILLAAWVSAPFFTGNVKADGTPVMVTRSAVLTPPVGVNPHGAAVWQLYQSGNRELEVEIEDVNLGQGTSLDIYIDGNVVGQAIVDSNQRGRLRLRTEDGQAVPVVNDGSTAEVRNGTTSLVSGVFGGGGTPSPTGTGTATPRPSETETPEPTHTPTASPTGTMTPRPSETETPEPSETMTPRPSETETPEPTHTPTASPTGTMTPRPSETETPEPSHTPTASPTESPSGTPSVTPTGTPHENELFAALTGATINGVMPIGFAEYGVHSSRTELEVDVRQVNLPAGTVLTVIVDGNSAGDFTLGSEGEGELRLRSDHGQTVPVIMVGSTITVNQGSTVILSGIFGGSGTPTPSPTGSPDPTATATPFGRAFEAHMNGGQMVPPVATNGTGEVKVVLSADETQATAFGEFDNLTSNQTGARIETTTGTPEIIVDLGVVGGTEGHFAPVTFAVTAMQVQQLRSGLWSAVISSVNNPDGEIRGTLLHHSRHSDFDGDGSHDLAVFRPTAATWYIQNSGGFTAVAFGSSTDRLVSGDYDGDGLSDVAVFSNVNGLGVWEIQRSSDHGTTQVQFGLATDIPVRGDFDGDGRLDLAVYRPSEGIWYIRQSNNAADRAVRFGSAEDIPMAMDVDGDGRDDIAVFRPSQGMWYWMKGPDARFGAMNFGLSTDIPVRGDFDGDGKADLTVYRPSTGVWYTLRSSDGQIQAAQFGISEDIPVAGDYDRDGKTDLAVFRPSTGNWYILRSSDGTVQASHFGMLGDVPAIAR